MSDEKIKDTAITEYHTVVPPEADEDLTEYIQSSSLDSLKARFGTVEEDESIRNEDYDPLVIDSRIGGRRTPGVRTTAKADREAELIDRIVPEKEFDTAQSEFDSDAVDFTDIVIDLTEEESTAGSFSQGFDTHTRVVFIDEELSDGIKRNSGDDVADVFSDN